MTRGFVIDTNVVVAGLITASGDSPVRRVLDGMLTGAFPFLLSPALLAEYRDVLLRSSIRERHGLTEREVDVVLGELALHGQMRDPSGTAAGAPDRGDDHLWQLLHANPGGVLVTGDRRLIAQPPPSASVISPRAALDLLAIGG